MAWLSDYINTNDFEGEYFLPFQDFSQCKIIIEKEATTILKDFLGLSLFSEIADNLEVEKIEKLLNGDIYTDNTGREREYAGLKSFLVPLIFAKFINNNYQMSAVGLIKNITDNSENASDYSVKIVSDLNHNKGVALYYEASCYLSNKKSDFENWRFLPINFTNN